MSERKKSAIPPPPGQPEQSRSVSPWVAGGAIALIGILLLSSVSLLVQYQDLQGKYSALSSEHDSLKASYSSLNSSYNDLSSRYSRLQIAYTSLQSSYTTLQSQYSSLQSSYSSLQSSYSSLQSQYSNLQSSYSTLSSNYQTLEAERDGLVTDIQTMNTNFGWLLGQFAIRAGLGDTCRQFITLDDPRVKSLVFQITGGWSGSDSDFWADLSSMQTWVVQHITYSYDTYIPLVSGSLKFGLTIDWKDDFWRFPTETLDDGHGDCEDMAIFLTTMIRCYFKYDVGTMYNAYAMCVAGSSPVGHAAVVIPVQGGKIVILDPAGKYITGLDLFLTQWLTAQPVASAMSSYFSYWRGGGYSFDHVTEVFNEGTYRTFSTLSEFISWISS